MLDYFLDVPFFGLSLLAFVGAFVLSVVLRPRLSKQRYEPRIRPEQERRIHQLARAMRATGIDFPVFDELPDTGAPRKLVNEEWKQ